MRSRVRIFRKNIPSKKTSFVLLLDWKESLKLRAWGKDRVCWRNFQGLFSGLEVTHDDIGITLSGHCKRIFSRRKYDLI
jgi:hypothetical protein